MIAFEDGTDYDYNDWYWKVTAAPQHVGGVSLAVTQHGTSNTASSGDLYAGEDAGGRVTIDLAGSVAGAGPGRRGTRCGPSPRAG